MSRRNLSEGYTVLPPIDTERYQERDGLEGPFRTKSGRVVYYDPKEGKYYDPDTDFYLDSTFSLDESEGDEEYPAAPKFYIVRLRDDAVASGPFETRSQAKDSTYRYQWYKPSEYDICYGTVDDDGYFVDSTEPDPTPRLGDFVLNKQTKLDELAATNDGEKKAFSFIGNVRDRAEALVNVCNRHARNVAASLNKEDLVSSDDIEEAVNDISMMADSISAQLDETVPHSVRSPSTVAGPGEWVDLRYFVNDIRERVVAMVGEFTSNSYINAVKFLSKSSVDGPTIAAINQKLTKDFGELLGLSQKLTDLLESNPVEESVNDFNTRSKFKPGDLVVDTQRRNVGVYQFIEPTEEGFVKVEDSFGNQFEIKNSDLVPFENYGGGGHNK